MVVGIKVRCGRMVLPWHWAGGVRPRSPQRDRHAKILPAAARGYQPFWEVRIDTLRSPVLLGQDVTLLAAHLSGQA